MSEEKAIASSSVRHRSPGFAKEEVDLLVKLVEKYKFVIINKSNRTPACQKREEAWLRITRKFNNESPHGVERSVATLIHKWKNLKREARKLYQNKVMDSDIDYSISSSAHAEIAAMMTETNNYDVDNPQMSEDDETDVDVKKERAHWKKIDIKGMETGDASDEENNGNSNKKFRASNFSSSENRILLKCIREEKEGIFSKDLSGRAVEIKNQAWERVTSSYNKLSPHKRSTKMLRNKFSALKKMARRIGTKELFQSASKKHEKLVEDKDIKRELQFASDSEDDWPIDCDETEVHTSETKNYFSPDPLSSVLIGDSGMGLSHTSSISLENPEIMKLKQDLINYQMETAKMERKRIEDLISEDAKTRECRAIETALRLRAARLDTIAAEAKFPPSHPQLYYPAGETPAQQYMSELRQ